MRWLKDEELVLYLNEEKHTMVLEEHELATIIAALRFWQRHEQCREDRRSSRIGYIATMTGTFEALNDEEVDELCAKLNSSAVFDEYGERPDMGREEVHTVKLPGELWDKLRECLAAVDACGVAEANAESGGAGVKLVGDDPS